MRNAHKQNIMQRTAAARKYLYENYSKGYGRIYTNKLRDGRRSVKMWYACEFDTLAAAQAAADTAHKATGCTWKAIKRIGSAYYGTDTGYTIIAYV